MSSTDFKSNPVDQLTADQLDRAIKARIARENAQKSTGPLTPEGKAIAARNAFKHGFASAKLIIDDSEREAYDSHLDAYFTRLQPRDQLEADAVRRIANAQWKLDILEQNQLTILELETAYQQPLIDATMDSSQLELRHYRAIAFQRQAGDRSLDLANRYMQAAAREFDRAFRVYHSLRADIGVPTPPAEPDQQHDAKKAAPPNEATANNRQNSTNKKKTGSIPLGTEPVNANQPDTSSGEGFQCPSLMPTIKH